MGLWAKLNQPIGSKDRKRPDVEWREENGLRFLQVVAVWDGWKLAMVFGISFLPAVLGVLLQVGWNPFRFDENNAFFMTIFGPAVLAMLGPGFAMILVHTKSTWRFYDEKFTRTSLWRFGSDMSVNVSQVRAAVRMSRLWKKRIVLRTDDGRLFHLPREVQVHTWVEERFEIHEDEQKLNPYRRE